MAMTFKHHMVVRQEHLNQYGNLFGGQVLSVIDDLAFVACARTYPQHNFVTRATENAAFIAPAMLGETMARSTTASSSHCWAHISSRRSMLPIA